jgi:hypothetical protein
MKIKKESLSSQRQEVKGVSNGEPAEVEEE